jgi:DNA-directed RNA polymerase subunit RPC12/RpoP
MNGGIVPIEENLPHCVSEVMCWKCGKRWIAVYPEKTLLKELECPACGHTGYAFLTGQDVEDE